MQWPLELPAPARKERGGEQSRAAGATGEDATARVSSSRRGWARGGSSEGKARQRPPARTSHVAQWPRAPWGRTCGAAPSPSTASGERASGEGERAKRRRIGKQKNLEGESEARVYIWWAGSEAETARHRQKQRKRMEANEERQKPLPAKSAPINRGHTIADRTAGNIQADVDGGSFGKPPRACIGKLL